MYTASGCRFFDRLFLVQQVSELSLPTNVCTDYLGALDGRGHILILLISNRRRALYKNVGKYLNISSL